MATPKMHPESESRKPLTADRLRQLLDYDPETGVFTWRVNGRKNPHEGKVAGVINASGGRVIRVDFRMYHAARLAWLHVYGEWPEGFVDHINRDRSDDSLRNLREADRGQNTWNSKRNSRNTSGHKGVHFSKVQGRWRALIGHRGKMHYLGSFEKIEEAIAARATAVQRLHGSFAYVPPRREGG
jgi:hypothetical protein